jgi:hypothetical protein
MLSMLPLLALLPVAARAQPSGGDIALAYCFLHDSEEAESYGRGGLISAAGRLHGWLGVAAELSLNARTADYSGVAGGVFDFRQESLLVGARVSPPRPRVRPSLQLLAGANRWRIRERGNPIGWESATHFALQPGIGVDLFVARRAALRAGGDLRLVFKRDTRFDTAYHTELWRFQAGVAIHLGGGP